MKPSGESVQLVRPMASNNKTTDQIIGELVTRFDYKTNDVQANENELNTVHQAFGSNLAQELIKTYEGSNLVSDSQQDLIGERYLAEQIRLIEEQQKKSSILDKWSHLLYEGEKDYQPTSQSQLPPMEVGDLGNSNASTSQYNIVLQQPSQQPAVMSQLRSSHSGNLITSSSQHGLMQHGFAASQRDLQSRLTQNSHSQSQAEAQFQAQAEAIARAEAEARAQSEYQSRVHQTQGQVQYQQQAQYQTQSQAQINKSRSQSQSQINQEKLHRSTSQHVQQPQPYLPQLSSSNLNAVTLDAYNSPQFKAMLDQLTKPINIPPENINYPPEWPSADKINLLCEPIYIPAPQPIVIPAPNIITIQNQQFDNSMTRLPEASIKPTVSYYPTINQGGQSQMKDFGIRQLNLDANLTRTGSNLSVPRYGQVN